MPFFGLGVHVLVALFFAMHAVRSGQPIFWLIILFSFPLLGSIVYFVVIYLPNSGLERGARQVVSAAAKSLNPTRELREARAAFDYTPTAQNRMRLAAALMDANAPDEAAMIYEACLKGPHASDLEIKFCAARAFFESGTYPSALAHLKQIRVIDANFRAEQISILIARTLSASGKHQEAKLEFEAAEKRFSSFEVQVEYAIWAISANETATANRLQAVINQTMSHWNKHTRSLNATLVRRLSTAAIKPS